GCSRRCSCCRSCCSPPTSSPSGRWPASPASSDRGIGRRRDRGASRLVLLGQQLKELEQIGSLPLGQRLEKRVLVSTGEGTEATERGLSLGGHLHEVPPAGGGV